jgi:hypothetical protein
MRYSLFIHRFLPAIIAAILSFWHYPGFALMAGPQPIDDIPTGYPAWQASGPADLSLPNRPQSADTPISPIKNNNDDDSAFDDARHDFVIAHDRQAQVHYSPLVRLPCAPAVASFAFRLPPIYRTTQRIRL